MTPGPGVPAPQGFAAVEAAADRMVHRVGFAVALGASVWLIGSLSPAAGATRIATLLIYCGALNGMLLASAAYNGARPGRLKSRLRALDHAMIFVMIAASYTPFALDALEPGIGVPLCGVVWTLAGAGVGLKLARIECSRRVDLALYLGMGWLVLTVLPWFVAALPGRVLALVVAGGVVYSLGSLIHAQHRLPFHNAIWHAMVVLAAGLHAAAVGQVVLPAP